MMNDEPIIEPMRNRVENNPDEYPLLSQWTDAMWNSPFMRAYEREGQIHLSGGKILEMNGKPMGQAVYNMIITKRDLSLYLVGMKPHRRWKVTDVKKYFGIKGSGQKLMGQFNLVYDVIYSGAL
jgi:hypothetical protein|tara:strand:+ start:911 stop:1282 length:372 start_codon:yes stop_codon:yes gene_type:complete